MTRLSVLLLIMLWACLAGCGSNSDGPRRYAVSGSVTYQGKPVPKGFITLEPDAVAGNSGPGGGTEIRNGKYNTKVAGGVVGGAYKVRIVGTDGVKVTVSGEELADGRPLFPPYETTLEFPKQGTVKNFEIPAAP
ncbi:hypothetical protein [Anatilimnocola floriformis]|uniref:hypothetical protein n=1 Tax=Anatilimnocola floriformis TaxID=2948575 RepID=UPI0020C33431|nr:hypothetical protein [Anatilimnocola floriformis]